MASTSEWLHFHQTDPSNPPPPVTTQTAQITDHSLHWPELGTHNLSSDSTVVSTTTTPLAPTEGRVSKPTRRRTRASRRTPTILLNTDPTNFRDMVQQFTGGPATSFGFDPAQLPARWNPGAYELQQLQNYDQMGGGGSNNMVQQGAGRGGGQEVVFGNMNDMGIFQARGESSGENRSTNNHAPRGFQF